MITSNKYDSNYTTTQRFIYYNVLIFYFIKLKLLYSQLSITITITIIIIITFTTTIIANFTVIMLTLAEVSKKRL